VGHGRFSALATNEAVIWVMAPSYFSQTLAHGTLHTPDLFDVGESLKGAEDRRRHSSEDVCGKGCSQLAQMSTDDIAYLILRTSSAASTA
jgi:hypothetical protein